MPEEAFASSALRFTIRLMLRLISVMLVLASAVSAQTIQRRPLTFMQERTCVFTCLAWEKPLSRIYYRTVERPQPGVRYLADQMQGPLVLNAVKTEAPASARSTPVGYKGPASLEFFRVPPPVTPVAKEFAPDPIAIVNLPANASRVLLLFIPQPAPPDKPNLVWRVEVIPDSLTDLPLGNYMLLNATQKKLLGSYSDRSFELVPGTPMLRKLDWPSGVDLEWRFWEADNTARPVHTSLWRHKQDGRYIIFIRGDGDGSSALQVKAITEYGQPAAPAVPPP